MVVGVPAAAAAADGASVKGRVPGAWIAAAASAAFAAALGARVAVGVPAAAAAADGASVTGRVPRAWIAARAPAAPAAAPEDGVTAALLGVLVEAAADAASVGVSGCVPSA